MFVAINIPRPRDGLIFVEYFDVAVWKNCDTGTFFFLTHKKN